jgi:hypothetical protein
LSLEDVQPMFFLFKGEFSVIADSAGGKVGSRIQNVQSEVTAALGIAFSYVVLFSSSMSIFP